MLDDVLVFSNTSEQHMEHVERVLQRFADNQLHLNLSKCTFGFPDANYLGQVVGSGVRKADPSKVSALLNFPSPTTASELRSWLGLGNYVSDYMRDWARISAVFSEHRGKPKNTKISFSKEQAKAFNELRVAIAAAPVLQLPDFNKPFYLETDASKYAIGSCLLQEVDGKLLPIAFRSVIMSGAQVNWCITEKEMYALVDATAHWRRYLLDRPFVVRTDHKPNTFFQTQPKLTDKLLRWVDHLAMYDPEYVYVPGEDLIYADLLSRPPIESYEAQERPDWRHCECRLCRMKKYDDGQDRFERGPSAVPTKQLFKHTCAACEGEPVTGHVTALVNVEREGACPMWGASPHVNHHVTESDVTTGAVFAGLVSEVTGSGDVTLEAIKGSLAKVDIEGTEIKILHSSVGAVTEGDITLAHTYGAVVIGFNVRPDSKARKAVNRLNVDIKTYKLIHELETDIRKALKGMLSPETEEKVQALAEVREIYHIKAGTIAGCVVLEGKLNKRHSVRLLRNSIVVWEGKLLSLRRHKDDAREVEKGFDCGLMLDGFGDIKPFDQIESFMMEEVEVE